MGSQCDVFLPLAAQSEQRSVWVNCVPGVALSRAEIATGPHPVATVLGSRVLLGPSVRAHTANVLSGPGRDRSVRACGRDAAPGLRCVSTARTDHGGWGRPHRWCASNGAGAGAEVKLKRGRAQMLTDPPSVTPSPRRRSDNGRRRWPYRIQPGRLWRPTPVSRLSCRPDARAGHGGGDHRRPTLHPNGSASLRSLRHDHALFEVARQCQSADRWRVWRAPTGQPALGRRSPATHAVTGRGAGISWSRR